MCVYVTKQDNTVSYTVPHKYVKVAWKEHTHGEFGYVFSTPSYVYGGYTVYIYIPYTW